MTSNNSYYIHDTTSNNSYYKTALRKYVCSLESCLYNSTETQFDLARDVDLMME